MWQHHGTSCTVFLNSRAQTTLNNISVVANDSVLLLFLIVDIVVTIATVDIINYKHGEYHDKSFYNTMLLHSLSIAHARRF